jgi:hypothetical protein
MNQLYEVLLYSYSSPNIMKVVNKAWWLASQNLKGSNDLENLGKGGRTILKRILQ